MKRVYVAGPVGKVEGRLERVIAAIEAGEQISAIGVLVFVPHFYHFWDARHPHDYEFWMRLCMEEVRRCDALFRMQGESPGADREVALAKSLGMPVFTSMAELRRWARGEAQEVGAVVLSEAEQEIVKAHNASLEEFVQELASASDAEVQEKHDWLQARCAEWDGGLVERRVDEIESAPELMANLQQMRARLRRAARELEKRKEKPRAVKVIPVLPEAGKGTLP